MTEQDTYKKLGGAYMKLVSFEPEGFKPWFTAIREWCEFHHFLDADFNWSDVQPWIECYNKGCYTTEAISVCRGHMKLRSTRRRDAQKTFNSWCKEVSRFMNQYLLDTEDMWSKRYIDAAFDKGYYTVQAVDIVLGYIPEPLILIDLE